MLNSDRLSFLKEVYFLNIMSKDLFQLMRQQEIETQNFLPNKKEIQFSSKKFITDLLEAGRTIFETLLGIHRKSNVNQQSLF